MIFHKYFLRNLEKKHDFQNVIYLPPPLAQILAGFEERSDDAEVFRQLYFYFPIGYHARIYFGAPMVYKLPLE